MSKLEQITKQESLCKLYKVFDYASYVRNIPFNKQTHDSQIVQAAIYYNRVREYQMQVDDMWSVVEKHARYDPQKCDEWIKFFNYHSISIPHFAKCLYSILNMTDPKINCLCFRGLSNSGKTLLTTAISDKFLTTYITQSKTNSDFVFDSLPTSSLCVIEECFFTPKHVDDFKQLLGGAKISINKKHSDSQVLNRIPVICTSQYHLFGRGYLAPADEFALNNRCVSFAFNRPYKPGIPNLDSESLYHVLKMNKNILE